MQAMVIPVYIHTTPWKSLMTTCVAIYYCKSDGVMFNVETEEVLSRLPFSRFFQGNDLFLHAEVGSLLFFLLKGFPGIPKRKGRMQTNVGVGGGLADVKWNGRQSLQSLPSY